MEPGFIIGNINSEIGAIPLVSTIWSKNDTWNTIKVRWSVGRNNYKIDPGIYAIGSPGEYSRVFVTANFKLSFDHLRKGLQGQSAWILVLNTLGINVWCAAGKGTFGTDELVSRIQKHALEKVVKHRKLILPQLSATGVSAHEIKNRSGFSVVYGPIRAADIGAYLDAGLKATPEMRTIRFPLWERLKLIPVDLFYGKYYLLLIPALFFLLSGINSTGYSIDKAFYSGGRAVLNLYLAYLSGCALTPMALPWIPFRRFSLKGLIMGWIVASLLALTGLLGTNLIEIISWFLIFAGVSPFMAMNFTGSSTFTSLSGVQKEMKTALPLEITAASLGVIGWIVSRFIQI